MLPKRRLGKNGPLVGCIGYGAMVLEGYYGPCDDRQAIETIRHALDGGLDLLDSADAYGNGHNEELIGRAIADRRDQAFICTKFGIVFDDNESATQVPTGWGFSLNINGKPSYVQKALDASLRRLNTDAIDLWYAHYPDPATPIEDTVGSMAEAVSAGKVRYLGLSNVTVDQVRRAHRVHAIAAVQYEYSLWRREIEKDLLPTLKELEIALVPWSPLGGGFLTGSVSQLHHEDFRRHNPKYSDANLAANRNRFAPLLDLAKQLDVTPSQLALAWLLHRGDAIVPIPGTRRPERIDENAAAAKVALDADILAQIDRLAPVGMAEGATLV